MMVQQAQVGSGSPTQSVRREWGSVTSGGRPEEVLERLDSYDIEWHLTEEGHLWLRQWQLGSEDFVPAERVAELRAGRELPADADRLEWLSRNLPALRAEHAGQWIAIANGETLAASDLPALMAEIEARHLENPFVTQIPAEEVVWTTTYAHRTA